MAYWATGERITAARLNNQEVHQIKAIYPGVALGSQQEGIWAAKLWNLSNADGYHGVSIAAQWALNSTRVLDVGLHWDGSAYNWTSYFTVTGMGRVGVGVAAPAYQFQLSTDSAGKPATSTWTVTSDDAAKRAVRPFTDGLATIERLTPIRFQYNGTFGTPDGMEGIGFSAQSLEPVCPYMVRTVRTQNAEEEPQTAWKSVDLHALQFLMVNAVKELAAAQRRIEGRLDAALIP